MAHELHVSCPQDAVTIYALIRKLGDVSVWDVAHSTWTPWIVANLGNYDVAHADQDSYLYTATFPAGIEDNTGVFVQWRLQAGAAPAVTDLILRSQAALWDGTSLIDIGVIPYGGVGQYRVYVYLKERTTLAALVGVDVDVWTGIAGDSGSVRYVRRETDGLGRATFWLDDGTYRIYIHDPTHTEFTYPETLEVTGHMNQSFY